MRIKKALHPWDKRMRLTIIFSVFFAIVSPSLQAGSRPTFLQEPQGSSLAPHVIPEKDLQQVLHTAQYASWVDPLIGTGGEGYTFPGPVLPWGMAAVSPHTTYTTPLGYATGQIIAPSGYRFGQPKIKGFGQTHLSGVGCPALGAPVVGVRTGRLDFGDYESPYSAENARAGYYSVMLDRFQTQVELSATKRVGVQRFTFPKNTNAHILIDANNNLSWAMKWGHVELLSETEVVGWSDVGNFCFQGDKGKVYFAAKLSKTPQASGAWSGILKSSKKEKTGPVGAWFTFTNQESVEVYVGISYTSMANALANLRAETADRTFDDIAIAAVEEWDKQLGKIAVHTERSKEKTIFYTALYHALIHPNVVSDVNGDHPYYRKAGHGNSAPHERYGVFSLWDTYRNLHSLLSLIYPAEQQEMLYSLEAMSFEANQPPQWELIGKEVNPMVGDPALSVLAEGYLKGFQFKDADRLFAVLYNTATTRDDHNGRRPGNRVYQELGYLPHKTSGVWGAVSTTLEYSYHDWSLAQLASGLGKGQEAAVLLANASGWEKLFDDETATLRPKDDEGQWLAPFDPAANRGDQMLKLGGPGYVEGNAYQYSYMLPHAIDRLIELHGGQQNFLTNLQGVFDQGHFIMWNEPDLIYPYLFSYANDDAELGLSAIDQARSVFFSDSPLGLPGNDDTGALSTWYIFSALGFYPVNPVSGTYRLGLPLFERVTVRTGHDDDAGILEIEKSYNGQDATNMQVLFNGQKRQKSLPHSELRQGGSLKFVFPRGNVHHNKVRSSDL